MSDVFTGYLETPIGLLEIQSSNIGLTRATFVEYEIQNANSHQLIDLAKQQFIEYFRGSRKDFNLPLELSGTAFQEEVWLYLGTINYGETRSYLDLATGINNPKAVRAVGAANGKNLIGIIIPCHRVIGSNGKLTGYAGGLDRKKWLLNHEKMYTNIN